jgi:hypothetical protein
MPQLTVHNAEVKTATVEIRTLTISGKQVTLAVFRQLQEAPLVAEDGTFNGLPWGTVNYHPDRCADSGKHLHAVWQDGAELRRSLVYAPPGTAASVRYWPYFRSGEVDAFAQAAYCAHDHVMKGWFTRTAASAWRFESPFDGTPCEAGPVEGPYTPGHVCIPPDRGAALREAVAAEQDRRDRHCARWAELQDLPQLFIAV